MCWICCRIVCGDFNYFTIERLALKRILVLFFCILVSSCTSLDLKTVDKNSKILVITQTSDQFYLQHDDYNYFPAFRETTNEPAPLDWKLSELFVKFVLSKSEESTFSFVTLDSPNIDSKSDNVISAFNIEILDLALKHNADYILALQTRHFSDVDGIVRDKTHFGFRHYIHLGLTGYYGEGYPYIHGRIDLIDARNTTKNLFGDQVLMRNSCYDSYISIPFHDKVELNLPLEAVDGEIIAISKPEELEKAYNHSKKSFRKLFQYALEDCRLLPRTSLTKRKPHKKND